MDGRAGGWDVIGDVHGKAEALRRLLSGMGYSEQGGTWRHPSRRAIFIGDLVDRGEDVPGVLALVKGMYDVGAAQVLLGNHEFNLLCMYQPDGKGDFLRPRSGNAQKQAAKSLEFFDRNPEARERYFRWFRTLPILEEGDGARFVHAYWGAAEVAALAGRRTLDECGWGDPRFRQKPLGQAIERLIKGPEVPLPEELFIIDREGQCRKDARIKWWMDVGDLDMRSALLPDTPTFAGRPLPDMTLANYERHPPGAPLVFFGHYGFREFPGALADNAVCVDYQGADKAGIGAYRWSGETTARSENFVQ